MEKKTIKHKSDSKKENIFIFCMKACFFLKYFMNIIHISYLIYIVPDFYIPVLSKTALLRYLHPKVEIRIHLCSAVLLHKYKE